MPKKKTKAKPATQQSQQSIESWSGWFSMAVWDGHAPEILSLYESQPSGALETWKQQHAVPDWLEPLIERWEKWKGERHG